MSRQRGHGRSGSARTPLVPQGSRYTASEVGAALGGAYSRAPGTAFLKGVKAGKTRGGKRVVLFLFPLPPGQVTRACKRRQKIRDRGRRTWTRCFSTFLLYLPLTPLDAAMVIVSVILEGRAVYRPVPSWSESQGARTGKGGGLAWDGCSGAVGRGVSVFVFHSRSASIQTRHEDNIGKCFLL